MSQTKGNRGKLIVISGPAGVGKGTVIRILREKCPEIHLSVSETTRAPRKGEVHGKNYFFVNREDFQKGIAEGRYLEYNDHFEHSYGTPAAYVRQELDAGHDLILEIEYKGAEQIREEMPDALFIFILPPTPEALRDRLAGRGSEDEKQLALRHRRALEELKAAYAYDYVIVNDDLNQAVTEVMAVISAEKHKAVLMKNKIDEIIGGFNGLSKK